MKWVWRNQRTWSFISWKQVFETGFWEPILMTSRFVWYVDLVFQWQYLNIFLETSKKASDKLHHWLTGKLSQCVGNVQSFLDVMNSFFFVFCVRNIWPKIFLHQSYKRNWDQISGRITSKYLEKMANQLDMKSSFNRKWLR